MTTRVLSHQPTRRALERRRREQRAMSYGHDGPNEEACSLCRGDKDIEPPAPPRPLGLAALVVVLVAGWGVVAAIGWLVLS